MIRDYFSTEVLQAYDIAVERLFFDRIYTQSELMWFLNAISFCLLTEHELLKPIDFTNAEGSLLYHLVDLDKLKLVELR